MTEVYVEPNVACASFNAVNIKKINCVEKFVVQMRGNLEVSSESCYLSQPLGRQVKDLRDFYDSSF